MRVLLGKLRPFGQMPTAKSSASISSLPRGLAERTIARDARYHHSLLTTGSARQAWRAANTGTLAYMSDDVTPQTRDIDALHQRANRVVLDGTHSIAQRAEMLDGLLGEELCPWWLQRVHEQFERAERASDVPLSPGRFDRQDPLFAVMAPLFERYRGGREAQLARSIEVAIARCGQAECIKLFAELNDEDNSPHPVRDLGQELGPSVLGTWLFVLRNQLGQDSTKHQEWEWFLKELYQRSLPHAVLPPMTLHYRNVLADTAALSGRYVAEGAPFPLEQFFRLRSTDPREVWHGYRLVRQLSWFNDLSQPVFADGQYLYSSIYDALCRLCDARAQFSTPELIELATDLAGFSSALIDQLYLDSPDAADRHAYDWSYGMRPNHLQRLLATEGGRSALKLAYSPTVLLCALAEEFVVRGAAQQARAIFQQWSIKHLLQFLDADVLKMTPRLLQLLGELIVQDASARGNMVQAMGHKRIGRSSFAVQRGVVQYFKLRHGASPEVASAMDAWVAHLPKPSKGTAQVWRDAMDIFTMMQSNPTLAFEVWGGIAPSMPVHQVYQQYQDGVMARFYQALQLPDAVSAALQGSMQDQPEFWFAQDFIFHFATLASFASGERGVPAMRAALDDVLHGRIEGGQLYDSPRYDYLEDILDPDHLERWRQGNRRYNSTEIGLPQQVKPEELSYESARGSRHRILSHLGVPSSRLRGASTSQYVEILNGTLSRGKQVVPEVGEALHRYAALLQTFETPSVEPYRVHADTARDIVRTLRSHRRAIEAAGGATLLESTRFLREFIAHVSNVPANPQVVQGYVEITDAPQSMLVRGMQPTETCQTCRNSSGNNDDGEVSNAHRFGQFRLANFVDTSGAEPRVAARMMIEITPTSFDDVAILGDNNYDGGNPMAMIALKYGVRHYVRDHLELDPAQDLYLLDERTPVMPDGEQITPIDPAEYFTHTAIYRDGGWAH